MFFFLDVCDSLHLSPGTVIYEITNKWAPPLEGRICAFFAWGRGNLAGLLSSQWIKVLLPLQRLITTTENERGREREGERGREGERDKGRQRSFGGRGLTPLTVGLPCALASFFKIQSPQPKRGSIKHSSQQGSRDAPSVSEHPNGL